MAQSSLSCDSCKGILQLDRPRLHCQVCEEYNSCADCHVLQSVSSPHATAHSYVIFLNGSVVEVTTGSPEDYWGSLLTPSKQPSPIFSRLLAAIFIHCDQTIAPKSTGWFEPEKFCSMMFLAGYTQEEFPPVIQTPEANQMELQQLDAWLTGWYRDVSLDPRMDTRQFPTPEPPSPVDGRIRMRDRFFNALMQPQVQPVINGMPKLAMHGLEYYFVSTILLDPNDAAIRLNNILGSVPGLVDPHTKEPFKVDFIPRACFPTGPDKELMERNRILEEERMAIKAQEAHLRLEAEYQSHLLIKQAMDNVSGGWRTDSNENRYYQQGL
ncbi:hypothetical protein B0J14DRAFT_608823 [Halenospora varia]|nr:hypothetical protein B0J14DRAFT_608823 [Halenospora varia]